MKKDVIDAIIFSSMCFLIFVGAFSSVTTMFMTSSLLRRYEPQCEWALKVISAQEEKNRKR